MKQTIPFLFCLLFTIEAIQVSYSQQHDRNWFGGQGTISSDTASALLMTFEDNGLSFSNFNTKILTELGIIAISNAEGELQFYTNGNAVDSWDHNIMLGGKGFNQGSMYDDFDTFFGDTAINTWYLPFTYQVIPDSYDESIYYMIHSFVELEESCELNYSPKLQISKINMSAREGRGEVVYKNHYFDEERTAIIFALVRHGNGKDWWVVLRKEDGLSYRSILLHRDTVVQVVQSNISGLSTDWFSPDDCTATSLSHLYPSPDGSKFVEMYGQGAFKLLSFDRCSGEVALIDTISTGGPSLLVIVPGDTIIGSPFTFVFSPSGRYLYGAGYGEFAQWDIWANDIAASKVKLGGIPWWLDENQNVMEGFFGGFKTFCLGPDGKIYNLIRNIHSVIEYPDQPGEASGLCLAADISASCIGAPSYFFSTPYPNYRLGALPGSACDTILSGIEPPDSPGNGYGVTLSPGIASVQAQVEVTLPTYGSNAIEIQAVDMLGRVVHRHRFPPFAYLHSLDVENWQPGIYNIVLSDQGKPRAAARVMVTK